MKPLDNIGNVYSLRPEAKRNSAAQDAEAKAGVHPVPKRNLSFTSVTQLPEQLSAPRDANRVEELRAAIAKGEYKLDPAKVADAMLELDVLWKGEE
ncbi:flagellar biosynthesis anti-sigma factor FlgM [Sphingomicrobium astaxanthinifaciens]|uniref:flagellar biosynthesis anti-sigma factor FlgM n=1 Tax=Sphingomicrobium astaxanthinifaciens TaxID=1227949 RepID=UPI001FCC3862|nr:flagellar biosynthesis anti-sigma factor FlgM [Sphingomicrobium astaxanthinifaciens]MCJ7420386.1 flagellar biosynthesis anti-sigma factor FlgM [Sphingomicrobium astaxanthinifaciens]